MQSVNSFKQINLTGNLSNKDLIEYYELLKNIDSNVDKSKQGEYDMMLVLDVSGSMSEPTATIGSKVLSGFGIALGAGISMTGFGAVIGVPIMAYSSG